MKAKEIQELISFLSDTGLEEVNIETEDFKIRIKRSAESKIVTTPSAMPATQPLAAHLPPAPAPSSPDTNQPDQPGSDHTRYVEVKSPMIGTFYRSPNPESPVFVEVGDSIKSGDTVCIIEAMKLFNEIESEVSGKIVKILVDNAQPVEYDQPLFLVDPS